MQYCETELINNDSYVTAFYKLYRTKQVQVPSESHEAPSTIDLLDMHIQNCCIFRIDGNWNRISYTFEYHVNTSHLTVYPYPGEVGAYVVDIPTLTASMTAYLRTFIQVYRKLHVQVNATSEFIRNQLQSPMPIPADLGDPIDHIGYALRTVKKTVLSETRPIQNMFPESCHLPWTRFKVTKWVTKPDENRLSFVYILSMDAHDSKSDQNVLDFTIENGNVRLTRHPIELHLLTIQDTLLDDMKPRQSVSIIEWFTRQLLQWWKTYVRIIENAQHFESAVNLYIYMKQAQGKNLHHGCKRLLNLPALDVTLADGFPTVEPWETMSVNSYVSETNQLKFTLILTSGTHEGTFYLIYNLDSLDRKYIQTSPVLWTLRIGVEGKPVPQYLTEQLLQQF